MPSQNLQSNWGIEGSHVRQCMEYSTSECNVMPTVKLRQTGLPLSCVAQLPQVFRNYLPKKHRTILLQCLISLIIIEVAAVTIFPYNFI